MDNTSTTKRKRRKSRITIGAILGGFFDNYQTEIWHGIVNAIEEHDINLISITAGNLDITEMYTTHKNFITKITENDNIDGFIIMAGSLNYYMPAPELKIFIKNFYPRPIVNISESIPGVTNILLNNTNGTYKSVEHLITKHNCKKIAFIGGPENLKDSIERHTGYRKALSDYAVPYDPALVAGGDFSMSSGIAGVKELIDERKVTFDALLCVDDYTALGAMKELHNRKIRIPEDVAVIGFDDVEESRHSYPRLSTIKQPLYNIGYIAVHTLLSEIKGLTGPSNILINGELITRKSCGCKTDTLKNFSHINNTKQKEKNNKKTHIKTTVKKYMIKILEEHFFGFKKFKMLNKWLNTIISNFFFMLENKSDTRFSYFIKQTILSSLQKGIQSTLWYRIIECLFVYGITPSFFKTHYNFLEQVWNTLIEDIENIDSQFQNQKNITIINSDMELFKTGKQFITTYSIENFNAIIQKELPAMDITSCFFAEHIPGNPENTHSRLLTYYSIHNNFKVEQSDKPFLTKQLIPADFKKSISNYHALILPLYVKNDQLGYMFFEVTSLNFRLYEKLSILISSGYKTCKLVNQVQEYSMKLEEKVKQRTSQLSNTNKQLKTEITERIKTEEALFREKERALVTLQSITDAVITVNLNSTVTYINPAAEILTGYTSQDACGLHYTHVLQIKNELNNYQDIDPIKKVLSEKSIYEYEDSILLVNKDFLEYEIKFLASPLRNNAHEIVGVLLVFSDISENRKMSRQILYNATHDLLTGLYNRAKFEELLNELLINYYEENYEHSLAYISIDQYKLIHDTCGHLAADELVIYIAGILKTVTKTSDSLAYLGINQFGFLFFSYPLSRAGDIAQRLCENVSILTFNWQDKNYQITLSIGIIPVTSDVRDVSRLLNAANIACELVKKKGGNRVGIFHNDDKELSGYYNEILFLPKLTRAMEENKLILYYQPIKHVNKQNKSFKHCEILLRMIDEADRIQNPGMFIPTAEKYNIMPSIDRWVINTVFKQCTTITSHDLENYNIQFNINLSATSLNDDSLLTYIIHKYREYNIPAHIICFEITETGAIANFTHVITLIKQLKKIGFLFSLDDFGSGWASFNYLKLLPVDYLKIDGSFVKNIITNSLDYEFVSTINKIGHIMGLETIAEFVENEDIMTKIKEIGVDQAQGYHISKPIPFELSQFLGSS